MTCDQFQKTEHISRKNEMPQSSIVKMKLFDVWGINFIGLFPPSHNYHCILVVVDYIPKWVEAITTPTNNSMVVIKFLKKNIFTRFNTLRTLSSDNVTHFC